ncbi:Class B acid phosphatase precursor [Morganella morganii]|nr:Class B acid phosphatase precursor [Morganella morganii]
MRKLTLTLSALALALSLNSVADAKVYMPEKVSDGVTVAQLAEQHAIHWISVEQIEESLKGQPPMAVGFDIDDTVLFSSPGFLPRQTGILPERLQLSEKPGILGKNE